MSKAGSRQSRALTSDGAAGFARAAPLAGLAPVGALLRCALAALRLDFHLRPMFDHAVCR